MSTDLFRLDRALAVVTGASGWLGGAMVDALAGAGASVVAVARRAEPLDDLVRSLAGRGLAVEAYPADVTTDELTRLLTRLTAERGRVDVLVNNAHVGRGGSMASATAADFDEAFRLAVTSAWSAIQAARQGLVASAAAGGPAAVVNIASMYGMVAPDLSIYATEAARNPPFYGPAKAALLQLTRYAAAELGPFGVRVNAISPGPFPGPAALADAGFVDVLATRTMVGRVGQPEDLRTAVLFLASPHSRFVTGTNIVVDGGWTSR